MIYLVSNTKFQDDCIKQISLLEIKYLEFKLDLNSFDVIVISSKNSINALQFNDVLPVSVPVFAISKVSAKAAFDFGFSEVYDFKAPSAYEFSQFLASRLGKKRTLYLRGQEVSFDIALSLKNKGVDIFELVCYKNEPIKNPFLPLLEPKSIIIFTSALNFKTFFNKFGFSKDYRAIAIGKSTALAMSERGVEFQIPKNPSLNECIKLAKVMQNEPILC